MGKNLFVENALKTSSETLSGNGALKYSTSNNDFVDNFAEASSYMEPRPYNEVAKDMQLLWSQNPLDTVKLTIYLRMVTRKTQLSIGLNTEALETQRGCGLKHEGLMRMLWLAYNHPNTFEYNLPLYISAGLWKDVFMMLAYDLDTNGWDNRKLNWNYMFNTILIGLANVNTTNLVKKYLPTIKNNKNCLTKTIKLNTIIGRWIAGKMFPNIDKFKAYKAYRRLKSSGNAHEWQKMISKQLYENINFDTIAGKALALLAGSCFLDTHNLTEKYEKWIDSKDSVNFTGYVHELFKNCPYDIKDYRKKTINAQFARLVEEGKGNDSSLIVVRDTSGSMSCAANGINMSSFNIAKAMALYFSEFLKGEFADSYIEFADKATLRKWKGATPVDKFLNDDYSSFGSTNFQSVIDLFIKMKHNGVPESEFPNGILCLSDGEFNSYHSNDESNFNTAINRLKEVGFSDDYVANFKIILWDIPNGCYGKTKPTFEDFADAPNFFYLSGYDASIVSFIFGGNKPEIKAPKTAAELFNTAMNQGLLNKVTIMDS